MQKTTRGKPEFVVDELSIEKLLLIEDEQAILDFRCPDTGMLLWPHVRITIFRMIMTDFLYSSDTAGEQTSAVGIGRRMITFARLFFWNLRVCLPKMPQADVCVMSSGLTHQWVDKKLFDRVAGYLSVGLSSTLTLEDHFEWKAPFPRHEKRVLFLAPIRAYHAVRGLLAIRKDHVDLARSLIDYVRDRALRKLGWSMSNGRANLLVNDLARKIASLPRQYQAYQRILSQIRPKILLIGCGCFGGAFAPIILAARSLNIPTAEYQHGAVSKGHDGYNCSPTLQSSVEYKKTLPDYFLSYGNWWNSQISMPLQSIVIGCPHRDAVVSQIEKSVDERNNVLILSDGMEFDTYVKLAKAIAPSVTAQGWHLVIRPHPLERSAVEQTYGHQIDGILIDQSQDFMSSLQRTKILISEISTGLFEAIGLTERIYLWDTPKSRFSYPAHPFVSFASSDELIDLIGSAHQPAAELDNNLFWAPDWQMNYRNFLAMVGVESRSA